MSIPTFRFLQRDAALPGEPKRFCDALIATKRFFRDQHNFVQFIIAKGDCARVENKHVLRELLTTTGVIQLEGDLDESAFGTMWLWFTSRRWSFPRADVIKPQSRRLTAEEEFNRALRVRS
jgi:hypothetical protein